MQTLHASVAFQKLPVSVVGFEVVRGHAAIHSSSTSSISASSSRCSSSTARSLLTMQLKSELNSSAESQDLLRQSVDMMHDDDDTSSEVSTSDVDTEVDEDEDGFSDECAVSVRVSAPIAIHVPDSRRHMHNYLAQQRAMVNKKFRDQH